MQIRRAQEKDIYRINELLYQVCMIHHNGRPDIFKKGARKYTDDELKAIFADSSKPVFVATDDDDIVVGYAFCIVTQKKDNNILTDIKTLYIDDLCVDETLRNQKIGSQLFEYVTEYAKKIGCYNVTLNVWCLNQNALKFYEHCNMTPLKIYMEKIIE